VLRPLKRKPLLYEAVQEELKSYIVREGLKPGDSLPTEHELAQMLGVSRNSVREAVKSLETLGILEARPGTGLTVRDFSFDSVLNNLPYGLQFNPQELIDLIEVRCHLEVSMCGRVVEAITDDQIACLHDVLEEMRANAETDQYSSDTDRLFHQVLWQNVNNRTVAHILDMVWIVHHEALNRGQIRLPADAAGAYRRHAEIVEALEKRNVDAFRNALILHYEGTANRLTTEGRALRLPTLRGTV
jgi:DNA-binding FadR family transcriptional regulator